MRWDRLVEGFRAESDARLHKASTGWEGRFEA